MTLRQPPYPLRCTCTSSTPPLCPAEAAPSRTSHFQVLHLLLPEIIKCLGYLESIWWSIAVGQSLEASALPVSTFPDDIPGRETPLRLEGMPVRASQQQVIWQSSAVQLYEVALQCADL